MQIVVLDGYANNPGDLDWTPFEDLGDVQIYPRTSPEQVRERILHADVILTNKVRLDRALLEGTDVRYIGVIATGFDIVDLDAARALGITVTNVPNYSSASVVQLVFSHLLNYLNRTDAYAEAIRRGRWTQSKDFCFYMQTPHDLAGMTMGIIGYGNIGRKVADVARAFGMRVVVYPHKGEKGEPFAPDVDAFFGNLDVLSLHAPLQASTRGILNRESLAKVKPGIIVINTARGPLVDERAMAEALDSGIVSAYLADVLSEEPMTEGHPFLGREDVFLTPHIGWASYESRVRLMEILYDNLLAWTEHRPQNVVS